MTIQESGTIPMTLCRSFAWGAFKFLLLVIAAKKNIEKNTVIRPGGGLGVEISGQVPFII